MSEKEDKSKNKDKDNSQINQDADNRIVDAISEGNVGSDSRNTEFIGAKSENMSHSASNVTTKDINRQSGDYTLEVLEKNTVDSDKTETLLTDKSMERIDYGKDSEDYIAKTEVSMETYNKNDDFKRASTCLNVISVKSDKSESPIAKCNIIEPKTGDSKDKLVDEFTDDDDMELRWDDDDGNNQVMNDNEKPGKLEDILSEEEFFDEVDMKAENSRSNPDGHILAEKSNLNVKPGIDTEDILSEEEFLEETDMKAESAKTIPNRDIIAEKSNLKEKSGNDKLEDILSEEEFLEETDMKAETVKEILTEKSKENEDSLGGFKHSTETKVNIKIKPKMDIPLERSAVDNINAENSESYSEFKQEKNEVILTEVKLLKELEIITEASKISPVVDIALEQSVGSKNADTTKSDSDILTEYSKEKDENSLGGDKLLKDSDIDISLKKCVDDNMLEANLLKKTETSPEIKISMENEEINENILKKDKVSEESKNKTIKDIAKAHDVEEIDITVLEEKLLEETETNVTTSEKIDDTNLMNEDILLEGELKPIAKTTDVLEIDDAIKKDVVENKSSILEDKIEGTAISGTPKVPQIDVSMEKIDGKEELLRDDQDDSCIAMNVDNTDQSIGDQTKMEEKNIVQSIDDANKTEQTLNSVTEMDTQTDSNSPDVKIKDKSEPDKLLTETITEDVTPLNVTNASDQLSIDTVSICLEDSPVRIKTDHRLNKPDVMLEIPTQELIDMDDTDLSMNIDQSEAFDSTTDVEKILYEEDVVNEKTVDQEQTVTESTIDKVLTDGTNIDYVEKSTENVKESIENVEKDTENVDEVTENIAIGLENIEKGFENLEKSTENIDKDSDNVDKGTDNVEKGTEDLEKSIENVDKSTETLNKNNKNVDIGIENVEKSTENVDKGTDSVEKMVKETIEESLERMFTDDEPTTVKEIVECKATTSQAPDIIPSTSNEMTPDTSDEMPEVSDSLGLLAESSGRVMEDDEEPEDDDDGDDEDDFDQDESSNLPSAEQSEDSNHTPSETEPTRDLDEKEIDTPDIKDEFQFTLCNIESDSQDKLDKAIMDIEVEEEKMEIPAGVTIDEETISAVDALLKDVEGPSKEVHEDSINQQMDIETVKLSDTDTEAEDKETVQEDKIVPKQSKDIEEKSDKTKLSPSKQSPNKQLLITQSPSKQSPMKMKKLEIATMEASAVVNIVDLEESSSSEDDIQEVVKEPDLKQPEEKPTPADLDGVTNVNIPTSIEIMCTSGGSTSEMVTKEGEVVISGIPKPPPHKPARLNTSEVSIKTVSVESPLILETLLNEKTRKDAPSKPKLSLEIFSLDSDDEESAAKEKPALTSPMKTNVLEEEKPLEVNKCINHFCTSSSKEEYIVADAAVLAYYDAGRKRRAMVCLPCSEVLADRTKKLIEGIKDMTPLLDLDMGKLAQDLVEISDSESEDEDTSPDEPKESIGEKGAKLLEENLAVILNETWLKYELDVRLRETQIMLDDEIEKLDQDSKEIDAMLNECQIATDKLRCELYATFEIRREETPALSIYDTPEHSYIGPEEESAAPPAAAAETVRAKRRISSTSEKPAKRPAIPLGYAPLDADTSQSAKESKPAAPVIDNKMDDDKDISVVKLSAESAPADLPPPGELSRPPLRVSLPVYAMKNAFGPWLKGRILEVQPKNMNSSNSFSVCRVKFDHKTKTNGKVLPARCVAYAEPADVRMTIGTRLIALFKDSNKRESYYSGVVAEIPNPVNNYRYLVFFDDGYAQYVQHSFTRLVCESSPLVWEEVHPFSREFVREYLLAYPERPMVRLHEGQHLKTEWNGKWWPSRVTRVDASLAQVSFVGDGRREWIYRGSTRLAPLYLELRAAERHRPRPMPRSKAQPRFNMPYVEYTRSDEPDTSKPPDIEAQQQQNEEIRCQRAVAKKSTTVLPAPPPPQQHSAAPGSIDTVTSRVVYYTPKNAVKPYKMTPHRCSPKCKRSDVLSLKELRTYNPLAKPLLSGWERQIVRFKGHKEVMYRAPCGRRVRSVRELHAYLRAADSDLPVDLFDFHHATHCLAEFVLNKCLVGKKDLSHGKENVPVPCVNYYDDSLPEFCSYNTERTPTAGVPLNLDPEFLCGCDCTDDCQDKSKCACWKMTLEGARTIGLRGPNIGYVYKRLPEPLPSGIYECNSRCKCKHTCLNRVAQHPLQLKLQVFKTLNRGWGIRALNDVPKGSFLCVYAGNLLTDATANLDGLNEGDEYLAELDYIEVVEQMKEGYEEDIPEADKKLDKKEAAKDEDDEEEEQSSSEEEDTASKTDKEDDDFRPGYIGLGVTEFNKRLRRREKSKKVKEEKVDEKEKESKEGNADEDCITISDDEEVREPSRFMVQAGMGANEFISKYKSVRTLFGKDEACYIMDAKVQGNIGRYLNHSCCPNVFVQNVFVDTHDPRFPWVAFFALSHIKAGTELTWNYNYDVGSVPGKILYCYCGAPNCRGRLL